MRTSAEHRELIVRLQDEHLADDLEPPADAISWSIERLAAWFESGGEADSSPGAEAVQATPTTSAALVPPPPPPAAPLVEETVAIPRPNGGPLSGKLLWPAGAPSASRGLVWASANPGKMFGAEHMESKLPSAVARACERAGVPLLRFDYSGVRGSGGGEPYDEMRSYHPSGPSEILAAFEYLHKERGCAATAIGGHSMGANMLMPIAAKCEPAAIITTGIGPAFHRFLPSADEAARVKAEQQRDVAALPSGVPKLFVSGERDRMGPEAELAALCQLAQPPSRVERVGGAKHNFEEHEDEAAELLVKWLGEQLSPVNIAK